MISEEGEGARRKRKGKRNGKEVGEGGEEREGLVVRRRLRWTGGGVGGEKEKENGERTGQWWLLIAGLFN